MMDGDGMPSGVLCCAVDLSGSQRVGSSGSGSGRGPLELRIEGLLPVVDGHPPAREPLHQHVPPWRVSWHLGSVNASFWGQRVFFDDMIMNIGLLYALSRC